MTNQLNPGIDLSNILPDYLSETPPDTDETRWTNPSFGAAMIVDSDGNRVLRTGWPQVADPDMAIRRIEALGRFNETGDRTELVDLGLFAPED